MDAEYLPGPSQGHYSRAIHSPADSILRPRANADSSSRQHKRRHLSTSGKSSPLRHRIEDNSLSSFSDEYDLAHEDPQILHDVQRALKGKARRDARVKAGLSVPTAHRPDPLSQPPPNSSSPPSKSLPIFTPSISTPLYRAPTQLDFSPSTASPPPPSHPIPRSTNNGSTLDWSSHEEESRPERKWARSISMSKAKEKNTPSTPGASTQEHLFTRHIDGIRSRISPQTLYKAELVARQLGRRYTFLGSSDENLVQVFRWYSTKTQAFRDELEDSEPFLWLSHHDRRRRADFQRSPLYISALVIERYQLAQSSQDPLSNGIPIIPQSHNWSNDSISRSNLSAPNAPNPFGSIGSNPSLILNHFGTLSQEDDISFEPGLTSGRNSFDSRRSADSFPSTLDASRSRENIPSPNSSHLRIRDFGLSPIKKEEVISPRPSYSEEPSRSKQIERPLDNDVPITLSDGESGIKVIISRPPSEDIPFVETIISIPTIPPTSVQTPKLSQSRALGSRRLRTSLPSSSGPPIDPREKQRQEQADEELIRLEYDRKAHLADVLKADNARTRMVLNRIAQAIKEYDSTYCRVMQRLGLPYIDIPPEVLEAFSHDPATVTQGTRLLSGWRAIEDIHERVTRQRHILHSFIARGNSHIESLSIQGVLDKPIASLVEILSQLEHDRHGLTLKEEEVAKSLRTVQIMRAEARAAYEKTSTITSVVYSELSQIASLQESYKDQYQRIWDWMLDVLTLIFDTVTPFWRTYGRTILDDAIAFLVIPWYRNEFTGEAKRYPITRFPKRSTRHWLGLIFFLKGSTAVLFFHGRTTISWLGYLSLPNIDHPGARYALIPFFWVFILFQCFAVMFEFAVVALQVGIWLWWLGWLLRIVS